MLAGTYRLLSVPLKLRNIGDAEVLDTIIWDIGLAPVNDCLTHVEPTPVNEITGCHCTGYHWFRDRVSVGTYFPHPDLFPADPMAGAMLLAFLDNFLDSSICTAGLSL